MSYKSRLSLKRDLDEIWKKYLLIEHLEHNGSEDQDIRPTLLMTTLKEHDLFASAFPEIKRV